MPDTNELSDDLELPDNETLEPFLPPPAEAPQLSETEAGAVRGLILHHPDAPETVGDVRERLEALPDARNPRAEYEKQCLEAALRAAEKIRGDSNAR